MIQSKIYGGKWAITPQSFLSLRRSLDGLDRLHYGGLRGMIFGNPIKMKALDTKDAESSSSIQPQEGDIAILGISGVLMKGPDEEAEALLGLTNIDRISRALDELAADPSVSCIILGFSSPGGETTGIDVLSRKVKNIDKNIKPVYAWTESQMSSAAYWIGSQARAIGMAPSAEVGSIGVYKLLADESQKLANEGTKVNEIVSGEHKLMGHEHRPLSDSDRAILQTDVSNQHEVFKQTIKNNRPEVKDEALTGLSYEGESAFELGLVDFVGDSLAEFVNEVTTI